jgi:regulator of sirC expression with transglutaminase-like and TPR domain
MLCSNARLFLTTAVFCLTALTVPARADDFNGRKVYQQTLQSTAWVLTPKGSGTGWLVDRQNKFLITNNHVVAGASVVHVIFPTYVNGKVVQDRAFYEKQGTAIKGYVLRTNRAHDLAVVELESVPEQVVELPLADDGASPGDVVHSIGNPGKSGALWVYTSGTVRAVFSMHDDFPGFEGNVVETQSPLNPGDSGGPVVNDHAQLVGVVMGLNTQVSLLSYCIDVSEVRVLLGDVQRLTDPHSAQDYYDRGQAFQGKEQYEKALADYAKALQLDPQLVKAYTSRAWIHNENGDYTDAIADATSALDLDPVNVDALRERGYAHALQDQTKGAIQDLTAALALEPRNLTLLVYRGNAYFASAKYDEAVKDYSAAIKIDTNNAQIFEKRGDAYKAMRDLKHAQADYRRALKLSQPESPTQAAIKDKLDKLQEEMRLTAKSR